MKINCAICKKEFDIFPGKFKENVQHTCSKECRGKLQSIFSNKKIKTNCVNCGKEIFYKKSAFKEIATPTCSRSCSNTIKSKKYKGLGNPRSLKLNDFERIFWERANGLKIRAIAKKMDFDVDYKFLIDLYYKQGGKCHYSGLPMILKSENKNETSYNVLSVDRLDNSKGYTKDNIVFCLNCINMLKAQHSLEKVEDVFKAISLKKEQLKIKIKKVYIDSVIPSKKHLSDAGYDLYTHHIEEFDNYIKVYTGIAIQPDFGFYFFLVPRSSTYKQGLLLYNSIGIIDPDYSGEIIAIFNKTKDFKELPKVGDRLVQLIPQKQIWLDIKEVEDLEKTDRNDGGFGSTGQ